MRSISIKTTFLAGLLALVLAFSAFTLVGCGEISIDTLEASYDTLKENVSQLVETSEVFVTAEAEDGDEAQENAIFNIVSVNYGEIVNGYVSQATTEETEQGATDYSEYGELNSLYQEMLLIATEYTDSCVDNILSIIKNETITKALQRAVNSLNSSINDCTEALSKFETARQTLITHFELVQDPDTDTDSDPNSDINLTALLQFKKAYGVFVESVVEMSECEADVYDAAGVLNLLTDDTRHVKESDIAFVQKHIAIKILPVFCHVLLTEVANKITWSITLDEGDKTTIDELLDSYETVFDEYQTSLLGTTSNLSENWRKAAQSVLTAWDEFCVEMSDFETALSGLDIATLALEPYNNNLSEYLKDNEYADVYLSKLQQFVNYSLPYFIDYVCATFSLES